MTKTRITSIATTVVLFAFALAALVGAIMFDNRSTLGPTSSSTAPAAGSPADVNPIASQP